jgi:hypothetical protein
MRYDVIGLISAVLSLLAVTGLAIQLRFIWQRKLHLAAGRSTERPTAVMSAMRLVTSFFAFYSFYVYGGTLKPFNHYVVWPRAVALTLLLTILLELLIDRRTRGTLLAFSVCLAAFVGGSALIALRPDLPPYGPMLMQVLIAVATILVLHGAWAQIKAIRRTKSTGALSLGMHQLFLGKDISTALLGASLGLRAGWPIMLMSLSSTMIQIVLIWHFHWVRRQHAGQRSVDADSVDEPVEQAI